MAALLLRSIALKPRESVSRASRVSFSSDWPTEGSSSQPSGHAGMSPRQRFSGFTLLELIVILVILVVLAVIGLPALQQMIVRLKLKSFTQEVAINMELAKQTAIRNGVPVVVRADVDEGEFFAFVNVDGDALNAFAPDPTATPKTVDYRLFDLPLPGAAAESARIRFIAPPGQDIVVGLTGPADDKVAKFLPDGSFEDSGAIRFGDSRGNYFEVQLAPLAGNISIRKWREDGSLAAGWYEAGRHAATNETLWEWY